MFWIIWDRFYLYHTTGSYWIRIGNVWISKKKKEEIGIRKRWPHCWYRWYGLVIRNAHEYFLPSGFCLSIHCKTERENLNQFTLLTYLVILFIFDIFLYGLIGSCTSLKVWKQRICSRRTLKTTAFVYTTEVCRVNLQVAKIHLNAFHCHTFHPDTKTKRSVCTGLRANGTTLRCCVCFQKNGRQTFETRPNVHAQPVREGIKPDH